MLDGHPSVAGQQALAPVAEEAVGMIADSFLQSFNFEILQFDVSHAAR